MSQRFLWTSTINSEVNILQLLNCYRNALSENSSGKTSPEIYWNCKQTCVVLTRWFWYAVTAVNDVSGKTNARKLRNSRSSLIAFWGRYTMWKRGWYRCIELRIIWKEFFSKETFHMSHEVPTCPCSSSWLFVNFSLSNEIVCFIQVVPLAGESGWTWILGGEIGSAFPATTQLDVWNA